MTTQQPLPTTIQPQLGAPSPREPAPSELGLWQRIWLWISGAALSAVGARLLVALALFGTMLTVNSPPPAQAASRDGICDAGEFCYYYNSFNEGSISDFSGSLADYGSSLPTCYVFVGAGAGRGLCVKNAAASVWNRSNQTVRVYFNTGHAGSHQDVSPGGRGNLNATLKNNNASHRLFNATLPPPDLLRRDLSCNGWMMTKVAIRGYGARVVFSITPTLLARTPGTTTKWTDAVGCIGSNMPYGLTPSQMSSLEKQFWCHDYFDDPVRQSAGSTWDLESWRSDLPWSAVQSSSQNDNCNWTSAGDVISIDASNIADARVAATRDQQAALVPRAAAGSAGVFRVVPGLAGSGYSFQVPNTDLYLRHQDGRLVLRLMERCGTDLCGSAAGGVLSTALFAADASFHVEQRPDVPGQRYRSYNYTGHHLRHYKGLLELGTEFSRPYTPFVGDHWFIRRG